MQTMAPNSMLACIQAAASAAEVTCASALGQDVGHGLQLRRRRGGREAEAANQPAAHVGVHRSHRPPERQRRDGSGGVAADAGQRLPAHRSSPASPPPPAACRPDAEPGRGGCSRAPTRPPAPRPSSAAAMAWGVGKRSRKAGKRSATRDGLRLLQHHLADQDRPRIGRPAPWHVARRARVPAQDATANAARGASVDRSASVALRVTRLSVRDGDVCRRVPRRTEPHRRPEDPFRVARPPRHPRHPRPRLSSCCPTPALAARQRSSPAWCRTG